MITTGYVQQSVFASAGNGAIACVSVRDAPAPAEHLSVVIFSSDKIDEVNLKCFFVSFLVLAQIKGIKVDVQHDAMSSRVTGVAKSK